MLLGKLPSERSHSKKAREKNRVLFNGNEIKLYQDLSNITLQQRRALRLILDQLRTRGIPYRWKFPFCLSASWRGHTVLLHRPDDLQSFCETLNIPSIEVPEWYNSFMINDTWIEVTNNYTPRAQRNRDQRCRSASAQHNGRGLNQGSPGISPLRRRDRMDRQDQMNT